MIYLIGSSHEANAIRSRYEDKIKTMRMQLSEMKQKQKGATDLMNLQVQQRKKLNVVENEMESLKREKINLVKRLKEDAVAHREWKQERELELRQLRRRQQKTQYELTKMEGVREKQDNIIKRKNEEVRGMTK